MIQLVKIDLNYRKSANTDVLLENMPGIFSIPPIGDESTWEVVDGQSPNTGGRLTDLRGSGRHIWDVKQKKFNYATFKINLSPYDTGDGLDKRWIKVYDYESRTCVGSAYFDFKTDGTPTKPIDIISQLNGGPLEWGFDFGQVMNAQITELNVSVTNLAYHDMNLLITVSEGPDIIIPTDEDVGTLEQIPNGVMVYLVGRSAYGGGYGESRRSVKIYTDPAQSKDVKIISNGNTYNPLYPSMLALTPTAEFGFDVDLVNDINKNAVKIYTRYGDVILDVISPNPFHVCLEDLELPDQSHTYQVFKGPTFVPLVMDNAILNPADGRHYIECTELYGYLKNEVGFAFPQHTPAYISPLQPDTKYWLKIDSTTYPQTYTLDELVTMSQTWDKNVKFAKGIENLYTVACDSGNDFVHVTLWPLGELGDPVPTDTGVTFVKDRYYNYSLRPEITQ